MDHVEINSSEDIFQMDDEFEHEYSQTTDDSLMYQCPYCNENLKTFSSQHNCNTFPDLITKNNELIEINYRKWLVHFS
ncbi:hypothetical protein CORT_0B04530 [Candida orthopsilosis Co 90-125]|uniref:Uncharacterized protein n=1 Tax=Candida orthopsilosis (strain 90-125) TaxID=1136231 RepID=H8X1C1_CANO9|nr:hypothetical protein CORT_0B04530 [Candida orthopsilosis Co 90-125]CCG22161.1 hypothetical protein CORT_0B04530 [Candida orthopsilosis Co 90-125]